MKGRDMGSHQQGPLGTIWNGVRDLVYRFNPQAQVDDFYDFTGSAKRVTRETGLFWNDTSVGINSILTTDTKLARAYVIAPVSGVLVAARFVGEDALATSDTNYVTFAIVNRVLGAGSTAMLAATDANTTKATGGSAIGAKTPRALALHGTAANLNVTKGDVIEISATVAGTLANVVDSPRVELEFATPIPDGLSHRIVRTAGSPTAIQSTTGANGVAAFALGATNEAMVTGLDMDDFLAYQANKGVQVEIKFTPTAAPGANQRLVVGLASAFNSTLDNITSNLWCRWEASGATLIEGDDGTTDTDDQASNPAVTISTSSVIIWIDARDLNRVKFYQDGNKIGQVSAPLLATATLQPVIYEQKASGTGTPGFSVDYVRVMCDRA